MFLFCLRSAPAVCFEPWIVLFSPLQITGIITFKASIRSTFLIINLIYLKTFSLSSDRFSRHPLAILTIVSYWWTFEFLKKEKKFLDNLLGCWFASFGRVSSKSVASAFQSSKCFSSARVFRCYGQQLILMTKSPLSMHPGNDQLLLMFSLKATP